MPLSDEDVREILRIIDESDLAELRLETEGFSLHVVKGERSLDEPVPARPSRTTTDSQPHERAKPPSHEPRDGLATITAPILGTFYRAEAPGKPPFVEVGQRVDPETIVCIIEVMKMMNSVPAGVAGTIAEVVADNAELVEYGEPLFRVEPEPEPA
jgi:acetyl-CoA carboxylase biotin carboxyl carrier protein